MNKFLVLSENSPPAHKTELLSFELTFLYGDLGQRVQECKRAFAPGRSPGKIVAAKPRSKRLFALLNSKELNSPAPHRGEVKMCNYLRNAVVGILI